MMTREITVSFPLVVHGKEPMDLTGRARVWWVEEGNHDAPKIRICGAYFTDLYVNGKELSSAERLRFEAEYEPYYKETLDWLAETSAT